MPSITDVYPAYYHPLLNNKMRRIALLIIDVIFAVFGCTHQHPQAHSEQPSQTSDFTAQEVKRLHASDHHVVGRIGVQAAGVGSL